MKFVYLFIVAGCGIFGFNAKRNTTEMVTISAGQRVYIAEGLFSTRSIMSYLTDVKKMDKMAAKQALKDLEDKRVSPISAETPWT